MRRPKQYHLLQLLLLVLLAALLFAVARIVGSLGLRVVLLATLSVAPIWFSAVCCMLFDRESGRRVVVATLGLVLASPFLLAFVHPDTSEYVNLLFCLCAFWTPQIALIAFVAPSWQPTFDESSD